MKILIVTQYFWPEEFRINDLAYGLVERGHRVTVLTGKPNYPEGRLYPGYSLFGHSRERLGEIEIRRVPLLPRGESSKIRLTLNFLSFVVTACTFGPFCLEGKFDAVIVFEPSPVTVGVPGRLIAWLKKAPLLLWVQDLWPDTLVATGAVRSPVAIAALNQLVRFVYRGCTKVLIQSQAFRKSVEQLGVSKKRVEYFPNSAETIYRPIKRKEAAKEDERLPKGFRIVFAGNIGEAQDFPTILSAAQKLIHIPEIRWLIIGDGRNRTWVENEIVRRGLKGTVFLMGRFPIEAMPKFFAVSDALLVTLRKDPVFSLTIPSKLQSYLACGRPIICALEGEGARIVQEAEAGICAAAGDANGLADAAEQLYKMSEREREEMGNRGAVYYERNFDREMLLDRLEDMLKEQVNGFVCGF